MLFLESYANLGISLVDSWRQYVMLHVYMRLIFIHTTRQIMYCGLRDDFNWTEVARNPGNLLACAGLACGSHYLNEIRLLKFYTN